MDISVGAEHVIANALIVLSKLGKDRISFNDLRDLGWKIQQRCNQTGVEAIILTSGTDIRAAVYDFSDYFEYENVTEPMIIVKKTVPIQDLCDRFVFCLPQNVTNVIEAEIDAFFKAA